uniref:hypothetical protein n=1 Tax=Methylosinus sp. LW4 TaxID=136993 RepID=UPI0012F7CB0B|nr:hypothetical protein [Methylosinus sp. LW4]
MDPLHVFESEKAMVEGSERVSEKPASRHDFFVQSCEARRFGAHESEKFFEDLQMVRRAHRSEAASAILDRLPGHAAVEGELPMAAVVDLGEIIIRVIAPEGLLRDLAGDETGFVHRPVHESENRLDQIFFPGRVFGNENIFSDQSSGFEDSTVIHRVRFDAIHEKSGRRARSRASALDHGTTL